MEYHVRISYEDNVTDVENSSEHESNGETYEDEDDLAFNYSELEISEGSKVGVFIRETCGCRLEEQEKPCSSTIPKEKFLDCRNNCLELTSTVLDMTLLLCTVL